MIPKQFERIEERDFQDLIDTKRSEDRHIDFKLTWSDDPFEELAKDVCAFANTEGGDIVVGMAETDRVASKVMGVDCDTVDRRIRNTESGIRSRIEPPVSGLRVQAFTIGNDGKMVFVIRVSASAAAPHRMTASKEFYVRVSAGNHPMGIFQIREAFLRGTLAEERIREFRRGRVESLIAPSQRAVHDVWVLLHVVSVPAMMRSNRVDDERLNEASWKLWTFWGEDSPTDNQRFNLDGIYRGDTKRSVLLYRDGRIEGKLLVGKNSTGPTAPPSEPISLATVRNAVRRVLPNYLGVLQSLDFPAPYSAMLSLVNVAGCPFVTDSVNTFHSDRSPLEIPDVSIADIQKSTVSSAHRQITDMLYQSFGMEKTYG
jgi:hypothetical protein